MNILKAKEVKKMMDQNKDIILAMVLDANAFRKAHIPNSLHVPDSDAARQMLPIDSKIIVYCSDKGCAASLQAYQQLESAGYRNIWRFEGGLMEWQEMGYPIANSMSLGQ